jgi:hypothetical protein
MISKSIKEEDMEWDVTITNIVGTPDTGNKNFTSGAGAIGTERGVNKKLRVAQGSMRKAEDFKNKWSGSISYTYMDNEETGSFDCTFDEKKDAYYIFNIV